VLGYCAIFGGIVCQVLFQLLWAMASSGGRSSSGSSGGFSGGGGSFGGGGASGRW
jgi:uncharacterized membrane protein YgcG